LRWGARLVRGGALLSALGLGLGVGLLAIGGVWSTYTLLVGLPLLLAGAACLVGLLLLKRRRSLGKEAPEAKASEAGEAKAPEAKAPEAKAPEAKAPEAAAEAKAPSD